MPKYISNIYLLITSVLTGVNGVKVYDVRGNRYDDVYSGVWRRETSFKAWQPFTVCARFQFMKLGSANIVLHSSSSTGRPAIQIEIDVDKFRIAVAHEYKYSFLKEWLRPYKWYHVCLVNKDYLEKQISVFFDGEKISSHELVLNITSDSSLLTVGYMDEYLYPNLKFIGNITQMNIWQRALEQEEIRDIASCNLDLEGDLIQWSTGWNVRNATEFDEDLESLCIAEKLFDVNLLHRSNFFEASYVCEGIGGYLVTPTNLSYGQEIFTLARSGVSHHKCNIYWVGIYDSPSEGIWRYHNDNEVVQNLPWAEDEPNGLYFENCGGLDFEGIVDDMCSALRCPFCAVKPSTPWTMFGSCETETHNMIFLLELYQDFRKWVFRGYGDYVIKLEENVWIWRNVATNKTIAILEDTRYYFPIGRKIWKIENQPLCMQNQGHRTLVLSTCKNGEFSCDDGTCVSVEFRCDLKYDCKDNSDELNCNLIRLPHDYKEDVPPRGEEDNHSAKLNINAEVNIETLRILTNDMLLEVSFNLTFSWLESRATYTNLKRDSSLNVIPNSNQTLWIPSVSFTNTEDNKGTVYDILSSTFVVYSKPSHLEDLSVPEDVTLFFGSENPLVTHRKYQASFTCDFNLQSYPFDSQTCYMYLSIRSATSKVIEFDEHSSSTSYKGNTLLLEYEVGDVSVSTYIEGGYSGLRVHIPLRRLHGYAYINIYLPTLIMLTIGFLTLFFKIDIFEVRIMTSLTTLLVMATLFTQITASLPKTSYFKMVDVWFLFCISSTFLIIVFHILIDIMIPDLNYENNSKNWFKPSTISITVSPKTKEKMKERKKTKHFRVLPFINSPQEMEIFGRRAMALVFIIFNGTYWMIIYLS